MSRRAIDQLERWELCGGTWRVRSLSAVDAEIDLCTCDGELVERIRTTDGDDLALLQQRLLPDQPRGGSDDGDDA
jgi:hypothetical protein